MDWQLILLLLLGSFLGLMIVGIPVVYAFFTVNIVGVFLIMGGQAGLEQLILSIYSSVSIFVLLPITLFILLGEVMFRTDLAQNMLDTLDKWLGRLPGRMALLAVAGGTLLAALSGASIGTTAMLGSTLVPEMEKKGYSRCMSLGPIIGSGGLSILIPPTGLGVILAVVAKVSVGTLLISIIIPGLMLASFYATYIIGRCTLQPSIAPPYEVSTVPLSEKIILTLKYIVPLGSIVFLVVGLIYLGVATPTESAALGTLGTFILAIIYRRMNWAVIKKSIDHTLRVSVMVLVLLSGGQAFSQLLAFTGASSGLIDWALGLDISPIMIIFSMQVILLILGGFLNGVPLIMVTIPVFMPVVQKLGFDPIWFSVLSLINIELAQISPPYGTLLFVMKGVAPPGTTFGEIVYSSLPFLLCGFLLVILLMFFPSFVTWLPGLMK